MLRFTAQLQSRCVFLQHLEALASRTRGKQSLRSADSEQQPEAGHCLLLQLAVTERERSNPDDAASEIASDCQIYGPEFHRQGASYLRRVMKIQQ